MKVGSLPWLLRHELRLWWREISGKRTTLVALIVLGLLFAWFFALLWFALSDLRTGLSPSDITEAEFWISAVVWLVGCIYAFTQAMGRSVEALFERGDLDLLVSAPISSRVIFASRLLGVALQVFLGGCLFVVPLSIIAVLAGIPELLGLYPAWLGISLVMTSLGMWVNLTLVRWLGARKTRTLSQIFTAVVTACVFLLSQLPNLLRGTNFPILGLEKVALWFNQGSLLGMDSPLWFPVRAIFFDPVAVVLTLLASGVIAWLAVITLHRFFLLSAQQSVTTKQRRLRPPQTTTFVGGLNRVILLKEWRIIWRNPYLLSRTFLQVLFLIPALVVLLRGDIGRAATGFPSFVAVISAGVGSVLTLTLTRICVSGEEAPDLLKSAPVDSAKLRSLKLLAALIPVWLLFSPFFIILIIRGEAWLTPLLVCLGSTTSAAILRLWNSRPVPITDIFRRQQNTQGDLLLGILEFLSLTVWLWMGSTSAQEGVAVPFIPLVIIALVLAFAYGRSRQLGTSLGF